MGYYINTPNPRNKARQLHELYDALPALPDTFDFAGPNALICVVENGVFDAAGVAFNENERDAFNQPHDKRPKTWLSLPKTKVIELVPQLSDYYTK